MLSLHSRVIRRAAALGMLPLVAACDTTAPAVGAPLTIELISPDTLYGLHGRPLPEPVTVRILDEHGDPLRSAVTFSIESGGGSVPVSRRPTSDAGVVETAWTLGPSSEFQRLTIQALRPDESPGASITVVARAVTAPAAVTPMLGDLAELREQWAEKVMGAIPGNAHRTNELVAHWNALQAPGAMSDILKDQRWMAESVPSARGTPVALGMMFFMEGMRPHAEANFAMLRDALPLLEAFLGPFPRSGLEVSHGFDPLGYAAPGYLDVWDRFTPTDPFRQYEISLLALLAGSYAYSNSVRVFMAFYLYNVPLHGTGTADWLTDGCPDTGGYNQCALLEVYDLVGPEVMAEGLRRALALGNGYGLLESQEEAFVGAVAEEHRPAVRDALARVTT